MAEETATFALKIDAEAEPAAEAAESLEKFRSAIEQSQSAITSYRKSMSLLKGSSDEVADAKAKLKAAIAAEQAAITRNNLGVLKLGGSYQKLSVAHKKAKETNDAVKRAVTAIGGPVKELSGRFEEMKGVLGGVTGGWAALSVGIVGAVAVLAIAAAALVGLEIKLADFILHTADANRNLALTREAFSGSEKNATAWGHAIDWTSEKTALSTAKLNELAIQVEKTYRGTRISGQGMIQAFHAFAEAAGAGRDDTVAAMNDILERGKLTGRTFIGWKAPGISELAGKGIEVKEVFKELGLTAEQSARGVVVSTDRMAAALNKVATSHFAEINAKKALSLGFQWDRLGDNVMKFTNDLIGTGGALEPLLKDVKSLADNFDLSTQSGQDMKAAVTGYGKAFSDAFHTSLPMIKGVVLEGLHLAGIFIDASASAYRFAQSGTGMFLLKSVLVTIAIVLGVIGLALGVVAAGVALVAAPVVLLAAGIVALWDAGKRVLHLDWASIGRGIVEGIANGLEAAWDGLKTAITRMGEKVKSTFANLLGIHSPSRVFMQYGLQSGQGYAAGLTSSAPEVEQASNTMAAGAAGPAGAPGPAGGGKGAGDIKIVFNVQGGGDPAATVAAIKASSILEDLEHTLHAVLRGAGVPVGAAAVAGG